MKEEANAAFERHCEAWDLFQKIHEPTIDDLNNWLDARDAFYKAQEKLEDILRQIYGFHQ